MLTPTHVRFAAPFCSRQRLNATRPVMAGGAGCHRMKRYDAIVLEVALPRMDGEEVCRRFRENPPNPRLKIITSSGRASLDGMAQMMLTDVDDYFTKPFSVVELQVRVRAALRHNGGSRSLRSTQPTLACV